MKRLRALALTVAMLFLGNALLAAPTPVLPSPSFEMLGAKRLLKAEKVYVKSVGEYAYDVRPVWVPEEVTVLCLLCDVDGSYKATFVLADGTLAYLYTGSESELATLLAPLPAETPLF